MNKKSMHSNLLKVFIFMFILSFIVIFGGTYIIKNGYVSLLRDKYSIKTTTP